jgi:5-formyltetrahydrofolate cyclo-ligase
MNKNTLREELLEKRRKLEKEEVIEKGNIIKEKLFSLEEYKKAKTVMFFVSFGKEIYTHDMVQEALKGKDKTIVVPKIVDFEVVPCIIENFSRLQRSNYGILEPIEVNEADLHKIDIILVPGIGFDKKGYRIGFGKGYYDKFLKKIEALKIGLCMDFEIIENIPYNEWDVPMDIVMSEKQIINIQ